MAYCYCEHCKANRDLVPIFKAISLAGVSRSTIYYWIDKGWVHWKELASGRRVICLESLVRRSAQPPVEFLSNPVQACATP